MKLTVAFPFAVPTRTLAVLVLGASLGGLPRVAYSQATTDNTTITPDTTTVTATTNDVPDIDPAQTPRINGTYALTPGADRMDGATARAQTRRNSVERLMRDMMARNGITTTSTQDAILTFLRDDEESKRSVRDAGRRLWNGVRRDAPAERLRTLLNDYEKALDEQRNSRQRAQTALDARVGYSLNARLESLLWLLGVLGEGQNILTLPQPDPTPRGPRIAANNNTPLPFATYGTQIVTAPRQIEGVVNAKNAPDEAMVWLEIRDADGRLWRMVPSNNPNAQPILVRQISGLAVGTHVLVRIVSPAVVTVNTPYSLLALATPTDEGTTDNEYGADGAAATPDNQ
ncbi:hypothetical protein IAD21_01832 [Abditibacteriota bacterium]|nr:hypothetical protein IAD21_01832 [Abditibacteriota bacterium]